MILKSCSFFLLKIKLKWKQCIPIKQVRWILCYLLLRVSHCAHWRKWRQEWNLLVGNRSVLNRVKWQCCINWFRISATCILVRFLLGFIYITLGILILAIYLYLIHISWIGVLGRMKMNSLPSRSLMSEDYYGNLLGLFYLGGKIWNIS